MKKQFTKSEVLLWVFAALYTGLIYSTLPLVPAVQKTLVEKLGQGVFDAVYAIVVLLCAAALVRICAARRGRQLFYRLMGLAIVSILYAYYLKQLSFAVERVHFLEYGVLGVLLFLIFYKRISNWIAVPCAVLVAFCAGLGDEAIQRTIPGRVGEIRDAVTNLFSAIFGIVFFLAFFFRQQQQVPVSRKQIKTIIALAMASAVCTGLFLWLAHGFGFVYETRDTGRFYSSLTDSEFALINSARPADAVSHRLKAVYDNEGARHLFQRDFYLTNDFLIAGGGYYRDYFKSFSENKILKYSYPRFLKERGALRSADVLRKLDKKTAVAVGTVPVQWPDSLEQWVAARAGNQNRFFTSRVKSTIITSFTFENLLFYMTLIFCMLGYAWVKTGKSRLPQ
jgi:hypothetical protein